MKRIIKQNSIVFGIQPSKLDKESICIEQDD